MERSARDPSGTGRAAWFWLSLASERSDEVERSARDPFGTTPVLSLNEEFRRDAMLSSHGEDAGENQFPQNGGVEGKH